MDRSSGVQVLERKDLEGDFRQIEPEAMRVSSEGWILDVDGVEDVVALADFEVAEDVLGDYCAVVNHGKLPQGQSTHSAHAHSTPDR